MFSKIKKYVIGFFVLLGGVLFAFLSGKSAGRSKERRKDIDKKLDIVKTALKSNKKYKKDVQDLLKSKKKELRLFTFGTFLDSPVSNVANPKYVSYPCSSNLLALSITASTEL